MSPDDTLLDTALLAQLRSFSYETINRYLR